MKREIITIIVVVLFFGLALAPSINANNSKEDELVKLDVEFCGLGRKHTVKLTQEEYAEVELLFDDIQDRLECVESDDEAVTIFNDAIVELDSYGLLGDLSVKKAKRLITSNYQILKDNKMFKRILNVDESDDANYLCLIGGSLSKLLYQNIFAYTTSMVINRLLYYDFNETFELFFENLLKFMWIINIFSSIFLYTFFPISFLSTVNAGQIVYDFYGHRNYIPSEGKVFSFGLSGFKYWNGELWGCALESFRFAYGYSFPAIAGFTGIKLTNKVFKSNFLGFAIKADLTNECPDRVI